MTCQLLPSCWLHFRYWLLESELASDKFLLSLSLGWILPAFYLPIWNTGVGTRTAPCSGFLDPPPEAILWLFLGWMGHEQGRRVLGRLHVKWILLPNFPAAVLFPALRHRCSAQTTWEAPLAGLRVSFGPFSGGDPKHGNLLCCPLGLNYLVDLLTSGVFLEELPFGSLGVTPL